MFRIITILTISVFCSLSAFSQDQIMGLWKTDNEKYIIKISKLGNSYQGRIVWLANEKSEDGTPQMDVNNPDEKMRRLPLKGNKVIDNLKYISEDSKWSGTFYNHETGTYFSCELSHINNNLELSFGSNSKILLSQTKL